MRRGRRHGFGLLALVLLLACRQAPDSPTPAATLPANSSDTPVAQPSRMAPEVEYASRETPLVERASSAQAGVLRQEGGSFSLYTGEYRLDFEPNGPPFALLVSREGQPTVLALRPLGSELNLLAPAGVADISVTDAPSRPGVVLSGSAGWADFALWLWVYPYNPGLLRYRLELTRLAEPAAGSVAPEWAYLDPATGEEAAGGFNVYADRASFAAPSFYGYSEALDSTLLLWIDLTRLNPFMAATRYSPGGPPRRQGRQFGHDLARTDLRNIPLNQPLAVYDNYLYLAPGQPNSEDAMFERYLQQVADVYDLIARPTPELPDWQALARETLADLQEPDTWVELNGKRYWRAYVADTRQSAEAITQLDVALGAARYAERYGADELNQAVLDGALATLPDFYNPAFGMLQNSGPLEITGDQGRGDTWYELGHVVKAAELGLMGHAVGARLALDSQAAWTEFATSVNYEFPRFYSFDTWQGTEREPDAAGGYALYMLRLADLGCGEPCLAEAQTAVAATRGYGFGLSYETHMSAMLALAAAELAGRTGDDAWLAYANAPIANLLRLSWIYEVDYGAAAPMSTFFGLAPTQRAAAITPKEQYETWTYLAEFLRQAHGRLDPEVEKLVAEFSYHTLATLASSLPPNLPDGVATEHPAAYPTVSQNRLDLYIPLEDLRDGNRPWGTIGQQVYGAGMAPALAAMAYTALPGEITVYSGYPLAAFDAEGFTLTGVAGTFAPVQVFGAAGIAAGGTPVEMTACGAGLCFDGEGGATYQVQS
jgi:hypothetical protein